MTKLAEGFIAMLSRGIFRNKLVMLGSVQDCSQELLVGGCLRI